MSKALIMKNHLILLLVTFTAFTFSCKKPDPPTKLNQEYFSANISGVKWQAGTPQGRDASGIITIEDASALPTSSALELRIKLQGDSMFTIQYAEYPEATDTYRLNSDSSITANIVSLDKDNLFIEGTFSCYLRGFIDTNKTRTVTSGRFGVYY